MCDKENRCEYFNILKIPCDDCKYKEQDESSEECRKCINGKCQFKKGFKWKELIICIVKNVEVT